MQTIAIDISKVIIYVIIIIIIIVYLFWQQESWINTIYNKIAKC